MLPWPSRRARTPPGDGAPTSVMGAGAQKAGTSWLHDYLVSSPACRPGYRKEYHVFDAADLPSEQWKRTNLAVRARREGRRAVAGDVVDASGLHRAAMLHDPGFYFTYFTGLLAGRPGTSTLDLTPDYGMLGAERFAQVRSEFAERGVRTVAVFLMRDPVERIWSHIRMEKERRPERLPLDSTEHLHLLFDNPIYAERTRYEKTLATLRRTFDDSELFVGFYETLFTAEQTRAVCSVIGIEPPRADFGTRVNSTVRTETPLPESTSRKVAEHLAPTYQAVERAFPDVDLRALWPSSRFVLG